MKKKKINFRPYNKVIVKMCVKHYHECWKRRCVVLHDLEVQRKKIQENIVAIKEEIIKREVEGLRMHVEECIVNEDEASKEEMLLWIRIVIIFKKRAKKSNNSLIRSTLIARKNYVLLIKCAMIIIQMIRNVM